MLITKTKCGSTLLLVLSAFLSDTAQKRVKDSVDYVSLKTGGIGQLLTATIPYVQWPHGMARLAPITTPAITDSYLANKIYGFPAGPATLMASVGANDHAHLVLRRDAELTVVGNNAVQGSERIAEREERAADTGRTIRSNR
jgi:hypothetical protein